MAVQSTELKTTVGKRRPFLVCSWEFWARKLAEHRKTAATSSAIRGGADRDISNAGRLLNMVLIMLHFAVLDDGC